MELSDRHRRYFLVEQGAIPSVFNLVLDGLIAWALLHSLAAVPLWGETSVAGDLLVTPVVAWWALTNASRVPAA